MSADGEVHYRPRGRIGGSRIGAHLSPAQGALGTFRDQVPFMTYPDARRIDARATFRDPFGNTFVRRFKQRAAIDVWMIADASASMAYEGAGSKTELSTKIGVSLARAATRICDRFGLYLCDEAVREDATIPPSKRPGIIAEVADRLANAVCAGRSAAGLVEAADRLVGARKLVFVVSDFFLPSDILRELFERLAPHDMVPVILADTSEAEALPSYGLVELADLESGARRLVLMRPSLKASWRAKVEDRRAEVLRLARQFGRAPIVVTDAFDADGFSRQLLEA